MPDYNTAIEAMTEKKARAMLIDIAEIAWLTLHHGGDNEKFDFADILVASFNRLMEEHDESPGHS